MLIFIINDEIYWFMLPIYIIVINFKTNSNRYSNCINLNHILRLIIEASSRLSKKKLQSHLYLIIDDIMLNSNLNELHR